MASMKPRPRPVALWKDPTAAQVLRDLRPGMYEDPSEGAWWEDAACQGTDNDTFYPDKGGSIRDATRLCRVCPVVDACLNWAITRNERHGVWGGMSTQQRDRISGNRDGSSFRHEVAA